MEGPVNKSLKPSPTPSQSGESNENELNHDDLCSKLGQTPKKSATKHFMSPTISAATKARKKILTERNESADLVDTNVPRTPKLDSTTWDAKPRFVRSLSSRATRSPSVASVGDDDDEYQDIYASDSSTKARKKILTERNESADLVDTNVPNTPKFDSTAWDTKPRFVRSSFSRVTPSQSVASVGDDDDEHQDICASDSSMKPYDPITSYTSPRPKFLRYNPNRSVSHFETSKEDLGFDDRRKMCFDSKEVADEVRAIVSSPEDPRKEEAKSNGIQDSNLEEHDDAVDEVRAIISPPESPKKEEVKSNANPDSNLEEEDDDDDLAEYIQKKKGWSLKEMLKFLLVIAVLFFSTDYISSMNSPIPSPTVLALRGIKNGYYTVQNKVFEAVSLKILQGSNAGVDLVKYRAEESKGPVEGGEENVQVEDQPENVQVEDQPENVQVEDQPENVQVEDQPENVQLEEDVQVGDQPENVQVEEDVQVEDLSEKEMGITSEVFDRVDEVTEIVEDESDQELESEVEESDHLVDEDLSAIKAGVFGDQEIENIIKGSVELLDTCSNGFFQKELLDTETVVVEDVVVENGIEIVEELNSRNEDKLDTTDGLNPDVKSATIEPQATESFHTYAKLGVPIFFSIIASLGLVYLWRHKKNSVETEMPAIQIQEVRSVVEKVSLVLDAEPENTIKKVEFKAKPPVLIRSNEDEISEDFGQSQAPIVELLSELVIGDVNRSNKSKISYTAESYSDEFSTAESPSYGSFSTPVKKTSKKAIDEGATPVRRSSRIRNRAMMSP